MVGTPAAEIVLKFCFYEIETECVSRFFRRQCQFQEPETAKSILELMQRLFILITLIMCTYDYDISINFRVLNRDRNENKKIQYNRNYETTRVRTIGLRPNVTAGSVKSRKRVGFCCGPRRQNGIVLSNKRSRFMRVISRNCCAIGTRKDLRRFQNVNFFPP